SDRAGSAARIGSRLRAVDLYLVQVQVGSVRQLQSYKARLFELHLDGTKVEPQEIVLRRISPVAAKGHSVIGVDHLPLAPVVGKPNLNVVGSGGDAPFQPVPDMDLAQGVDAL